MRVISTKHFIFTFITHTSNTLILLFTLYLFTYFQLFFLTLWAFYLNSFTLVATLICDINVYFRKSNSLEKFYYFIHHKLSPISTSLSIAITILFWLLTFLGPHFMVNAITFKEYLINIYLHGIQTLIVVIDIFMAEHSTQNKVFECKEIRIISFIYLLYVIVCASGKYVCGFNPYEFMKYTSIKQLIIASIIIYIFIFDSYQVYIWLYNIKYKLFHTKKIKVNDDTPANANDNNNDIVITK